MNYERFTQIWKEKMPKGLKSTDLKKLQDALIKVANGDHSQFDKIDKALKEIDLDEPFVCPIVVRQEPYDKSGNISTRDIKA